MQCLTNSRAGLSFDEDLAKIQNKDDRPAGDEHREPPQAETPAAPSSADGDRLSTVPEGDEKADMFMEEWARELEAELEPVVDYGGLFHACQDDSRRHCADMIQR